MGISIKSVNYKLKLFVSNIKPLKSITRFGIKLTAENSITNLAIALANVTD